MKAIATIQVLRFALIAGMVTTILSSCSSTRYGYISRVKTSTKEIKEAEAAQSKPGDQAENNDVTAEVPEEETTSAVPAEKTTLSLNREKAGTSPLSSVKKNKKTGLAQHHKEQLLLKMENITNKGKVKEEKGGGLSSLDPYLKLGILLILIGLLLSFFPDPIDWIGYIVMLVGVVFIIIWLIKML